MLGSIKIVPWNGGFSWLIQSDVNMVLAINITRIKLYFLIALIFIQLINILLE